MYRGADIYLVDNLLANIDGQTSKNLFDKCIGPDSYLARKRTTRIFVTQQIQLLKNVDWILVLKNVCVYFNVYFREQNSYKVYCFREKLSNKEHQVNCHEKILTYHYF